MLENNLIKQCLCGNNSSFIRKTMNTVDTLTCTECDLTHQLLSDFTEADLDAFYTKDYHISYQQKKNVVTYADRYEHDSKVAKMRMNAYADFIKEGMTGIDIGSSNSAFVHEAIARGVQCVGLEPSEVVGDNAVTIRGRLEDTDLHLNTYNFVTMHDSIEHMIDPAKALRKVHSILSVDGIAIIDVPDFYIPEGFHHWKTIEHLWFFTRDNFVRLIEDNGFRLIGVTTPIPGKLVVYARAIK